MQRLKFWVILAVAVGLGLLITWVDSRPTWDDAGITAGAILILTGLLGLSMPQRPWLWALAVGIWIPAQDIFLHHNFGLSPVIVIAFVGAYAGALVRKALVALR